MSKDFKNMFAVLVYHQILAIWFLHVNLKHFYMNVASYRILHIIIISLFFGF